MNSTPIPYALTVVMLAGSAGLYVVGKFVLGRRFDAAVTKASVQSAGRPLGWAASVPVLLPFLAVAGLALLPHVGVVLTSVSRRRDVVRLGPPPGLHGPPLRRPRSPSDVTRPVRPPGASSTPR